MAKRIFIEKNIRKRRVYFSLLLVFILFLGIGFSNLVSNLSIGGTLGISKYDHTLYGVFEKEFSKGAYVRKYTGNHQDSYAGTGTKDIYHWYATTDADVTAILDKNNVIFAGHCWQMLRSTDTGGVKLIYNGEPENNQCLKTRGNHIGYASRTSQNLASNYYYGTSYEYDSTNNVFSLSGTITQETWNASTGPTLVGKYTCKQTTESASCTSLYFVESYLNNSSGYVIPLNSNNHYSQFGELYYNEAYNSPSYSGYMYNAVYTEQSIAVLSEYVLSHRSLSTNWWFAHDVVWGSPVSSNYNLVNPYQASTISDYSNLVGEYTFSSSNQSYTNVLANYIVAVNDTTLYYIQLTSSGNHTLADYNYSYTYGTSYTDNGNGTYTINNPTTIQKTDWYTEYSNLNNKFICKNATNNTCSELWYSISTDNRNMQYVIVSNNYKYSNGFTWDGSKYVLENNTSVSFYDISNATNQASLNNAHYTCWNTTGECTSVSYVFYFSDNRQYYINLTNGENIEDALNKMLYANDVNTKNSVIKKGVDAWYAKYLSSYDSYIEDTIFCNDRSQRNADTNGWNPNGGKVTEGIQFKENSITKDLSCTNETDQFSTLNSKAHLIYKVGLISSPEMHLLGNYYIRISGQSYWLLSPRAFNNAASISTVFYTGALTGYVASSQFGVRPAISLKPGIEYVSGSGTMADPYIVEAEPVVSVNGVGLNKSETTIKVGASETITATVTPSNAVNQTLTWTSSDPSIATVNDSGVITAVDVGTATITATSQDGYYKASIVVHTNMSAHFIYGNENNHDLVFRDNPSMSSNITYYFSGMDSINVLSSTVYGNDCFEGNGYYHVEYAGNTGYACAYFLTID